ncbi:MAG: HAD-IA family hydrolase [Deltaproteobacteria bacterium]|nr:HAD-IA family hydrolase [Deltaproteobacteria bacterium]
MLEKDLLIFDLDGTLIDSSADIAAAANRTIESMGYARRAVDEIKADIGWGVKTLLERLMPNEPPDRIEAGRRMFLDFYGAHLVVDTYVYPGVQDTLEHFKRLGKKMAVVTNKPVKLSERVLTRFALRDYFLTVIGGDSFANRKPHPEPVEAALKAAGASSHEAVLIGDSPIDCEAGAAALVSTIGVSYGFRAKDELNGCIVVIDGFDELKNIVR